MTKELESPTRVRVQYKVEKDGVIGRDGEFGQITSVIEPGLELLRPIPIRIKSCPDGTIDARLSHIPKDLLPTTPLFGWGESPREAVESLGGEMVGFFNDLREETPQTASKEVLRLKRFLGYFLRFSRTLE